MGNRKLTPEEVRAYQELARAARNLRQAQSCALKNKPMPRRSAKGVPDAK